MRWSGFEVLMGEHDCVLCVDRLKLHKSGKSPLRADRGKSEISHIICVGEKIVWNRPGRAGRDKHSRCVGIKPQ